MGGNRTSQSALLINGKTQTSSAFDLHSWQGLTEVLRVGKQSLKDPHLYAEFRDLVLQYAQRGGDHELKKQIDSVLVNFKKSAEFSVVQGQPLPVHEEVVPVETATIPVPPVVEKPPYIEEVEKASSVASQAYTANVRRTTPQFRTVPLTSSVSPQEQIQEIDVVTEDVVVVAMPSPAPLPQEEKHVREEIYLETAGPSVVPVIPVYEPEATSTKVFKTIEEYKARISEIKRLVNAHVGNPASLIDTHNTHGRAYMSALLSALKATGGAGGGSVDEAMRKLEETYAVIVADKKEYGVQEKMDSVSPVKREETSHASEWEDSRVAHESEQKMPYVTTLKDLSEDAPQIIEDAHKNKFSAKDTLEALLVEEKIDTEERAKEVSFYGEKDRDEPSEVSIVSGRSLHAEIAQARESLLHETSTPISSEHVVLDRVSAEHTDEHLHNLEHTPSKQVELSAPEITAALNQLLHEWSIFSGSGIFGMGPSGAEHPLYAQLSPLSMGEVISGRWEGSSAGTTKVIKQYVDAWRHEQGIAYAINETFDHYLRRVVQRILKRRSGGMM